MSLPVELFECIAEHLDAADRARLSCVCVSARRGCVRQRKIKIVVPHRPTEALMKKKHRMDTLASWLILRLSFVEHLEMIGDMFQWNFAWRYKGFALAPHLKTAHMFHIGGMVLCVSSLEEILPSCPNLHKIYINAPNLHVGTGLSRMTATEISIDCDRISGEPMSWTMPLLQKLTVNGAFQDTVNLTGLYFSELKYLECQSTLLLTVVPYLPKLETLILDSTCCGFRSVDMLMVHTKMICPLKNLRLKGGEWLMLNWIPETLETLEFMFCTGGVGPVNVPRVKHVTILGSRVVPSFIKSLSKMNLESFRYESYGLPPCKPKLRVNSKVVRILENPVITLK
jgi:hypothetical protein